MVAVLAFVLASRVARADGTGRWLATDAGRGGPVAPRRRRPARRHRDHPGAAGRAPLPGADGESLVDLDGGGGGGDRVTLSPLVDIRSRLVEQESIEAFRVEAAAPAYWRLTALDEFDGQIWSSSGSYVEAEGRLPDTLSPRPAPPAHPALPHRGAWPRSGCRPRSSLSPWTAPTPTWTGTATRRPWSSAPAGRPPTASSTTCCRSCPASARRPLGGHRRPGHQFLARFTRLPAATQPIADRYAAEAVGTETDAYAQALGLQNWFRTRFRYSLDVRPGHSTNALADFLDPAGSRSGYCEQFAGAYAALARSLGLPARVAVGFTPGEEDPDAPGTYVVTGRNAHAWPEVYFAGVGWVPFEPTPGRGAPGAEAYTLVTADQATPEESVAPTSVPTTATLEPRPQRPRRVEDLLPEDLAAAADGGAGPERSAACCSGRRRRRRGVAGGRSPRRVAPSPSAPSAGPRPRGPARSPRPGTTPCGRSPASTWSPTEAETPTEFAATGLRRRRHRRLVPPGPGSTGHRGGLRTRPRTAPTGRPARQVADSDRGAVPSGWPGHGAGCGPRSRRDGNCRIARGLLVLAAHAVPHALAGRAEVVLHAVAPEVLGHLLDRPPCPGDGRCARR